MSPLDNTLFFTIDWRNREQTNQLINSLSDQDITLHIIVNDDLPPSYNSPLESRLKIEVHQTGKNTGFAAACNLAIQIATQNNDQFIMHFNNDVTVEHPDQLKEFINEFQSHPDDACASPTILKTDGAVVFAGIKWFARLSSALIVSKRKVLPINISHQKSPFFHGSCFIARTEALNQINGFEEQYFAYREEHDLAHRLTTTGWKIAYIPKLEVLHVASASSSRTPYFRELLITRGQLLYFKKNVRGVSILPFLLLLTLKTLTKSIIALLKNDKETLRAVRDAIKNQLFNHPLKIEVLGEKILL